jgi:glycerophosphoryl diester phosphodiesterase
VTPWLETDTWVSKDGVLMIHHDLNLCRTTNIGDLPEYDCDVAANNPLGRFPYVRDLTLEELKQLDVGSWFDPSFAGTRMPTLEEALQLVDGTGVPLLVEVKNPGQSVLLKEILDRTGLSMSNIIVWARGAFAFDEYHPLLPGIRQISGQFEIPDVTNGLLLQRSAAGDYGIAVQAAGLTQEFVDRVHAYGLLLYTIPTSTGGDPYADRIAFGVDGIHTANEVEWGDILGDYPCIDRIDNDGDGKIDFDGVDVDFDIDRVVDVPPDLGCDDRLAGTEVAACQDTIDNDGDGAIDLADPGCADPNDRDERADQIPSLPGMAGALLGALLLAVAYALTRPVAPVRDRLS